MPVKPQDLRPVSNLLAETSDTPLEYIARRTAINTE